MPGKKKLDSEFPVIDVDEIMERIRRELSVQVDEREDPKGHKAGQTVKAVRCCHLLEYEDELFLRHTYRTLLNRLPEPEGLEFWLFKLREVGWAKTEILWAIHSSREGRIHNTHLPGLKTSYALHVVKRFFVRIPVLGYLIRLGLNVLRLPRIHETVSRLERRRLADSTRQEHAAEIREDMMRLGQRVDELEEKIAGKDQTAAAKRQLS